jgi:threonine dehydrogenase-like Zn-dependent dehydrogenase
MRAIAVHPGNAGSIHLEDVPKPSVDQIPNGRDVLVRVLCVGVAGTDKEARALFPGWLEQLLTTPIDGLEIYEEMLRVLIEDRDAINVVVEVNGSK